MTATDTSTATIRRSALATVPDLPEIQPRRIAPWRALMLGRYAHKVRMQALSTAVRQLGGEVTAVEDDITSSLLRVTEPALAVRFAFTAGTHAEEALARGILRARGLPLLVLDLGFIRRSQHGEDLKGYNQLGLGRCCWIPGGPLPPDRLALLDVTIAPPVTRERPAVALLLGQMPGDSQHGLNSAQLAAWLIERGGYWLARGYELHYRPHPSAPAMELRGLKVTPRPVVNEPLSRALAAARVAVCFNSTAGLEAILAGVAVDCSPEAHYAHVAGYGWGRDVNDAAAPYVDLTDVTEFLAQLAYGQWTIPELQSGLALRWLARHCPELHALDALLRAAEVTTGGAA
jgi:hypothetical protein